MIEIEMVPPGKIIEDFQVEYLLGSGKAGKVYLAIAERSTPLYERGQRVAIKVYNSWLLETSGGIERIRREFDVPSRLDIDHLLKPLMVRVNPNSRFGTFLVMPYMEGVTLDNWIADNYPKHGRVSTDYFTFARTYFRHILLALAALHEEGVVHRDVKPQNVMISGNRATLMDLGVLHVGSECTLAGSESFLGTIRYSDPKYLFDHQVSPMNDCCSFLLLAYHVIFGEPPYSEIQSSRFADLILNIRDKKLRLPDLDELETRFNPEGIRTAYVLSWLIKDIYSSDRPTLKAKELVDIVDRCHCVKWWTEPENPLLANAMYDRVEFNQYAKLVETGTMENRMQVVNRMAPPDGGYGKAIQFQIKQATLYLMMIVETDPQVRSWLCQRKQERDKSYIPREE